MWAVYRAMPNYIQYHWYIKALRGIHKFSGQTCIKDYEYTILYHKATEYIKND